MVSKIFAPVFLAGAAAAIILAPTAGATTADCDSNGGTSVCTRNGHAAIVATPDDNDTRPFSFAPGGNPFGAGPMPPLLALD